MSNLGSTSSDLAKEKKFFQTLLYVQHAYKEMDTVSETSDRDVEEYFLGDRTNFTDPSFMEYLRSPNANLCVLQTSMGDWIRKVTVYSNSLPIRLHQLKDVTIHAFVVFQTWNDYFHNSTMWWSLEKNGTYIVLQQSPNKDDVINKIYDTEKKTSVERLGPIQKQKSYWTFEDVSDLMQIIVDTNEINERYHLLYSNCQNFASFVFEKLSHGREKWSTVTSEIVDRFAREKKKIQPKIQVNADKYKSILKDENFDFYRAMIEGRRKDFEELTNHLTIECLNDVDSQGYTLLEWATVFSSSDWPIDEFLKEKGAQNPSDEKLFKQNVFFIALKYLPSNTKSKSFDSFDGIDINSVNPTGDTSLHLALYGGKWELAEEILNRFESYDVNITNSVGDTPLHLAAKLKWDFDLFNVFLRILERTNQESINKTDRFGYTALHYAIIHLSEISTEALLNHKDVDVNVRNDHNRTPLHLASSWEDISMDLFKQILEKTIDINAQDQHKGWTALHYAILSESEIMTKELLAHNDVDVNVKDNNNETVLQFAIRMWDDIPADVFKIILEKSTSDIINTQDEIGKTTLHCAINEESEIAVKELLAHKDVNVNVKNKNNETALHLACRWWKDIPVDLFNLILEKSTDVINAQDDSGNTALYYAIIHKSEITTKELLAHNDVDVNIKNNSNYTLLQLASSWKDIPVDLFNFIFKKSTDLNAQHINGHTAFHLAIFSTSEIATKALLTHEDVDVNIKNNNNERALHWACKWKDMPMDLFKLILEKTTDVNAQDKDGRTALHWAIGGQSETATKELLAHSDVDDKVKNNKNETALHFTSQWPDIPSDLFKLILEKSNDINAQDDEGWTALHCAITHKSEIATKELLNHKDVDVNIKNNNNCTPLHFASNYWKDIPGDLFKIILEKSTDINEQDKDGKTALHFAILFKSEIMTKALLAHKDVDVSTALGYVSEWEDIPSDLFKLISERSTNNEV